jgi:predicted nucleotidyltransferase component of viral defense system
MIPRNFITEWKEKAQWPDDAQVEQDLIIERALIAIYQDDFLAGQLAFRGGTALHKLWLQPQLTVSTA